MTAALLLNYCIPNKRAPTVGGDETSDLRFPHTIGSGRPRVPERAWRYRGDDDHAVGECIAARDLADREPDPDRGEREFGH